MYLITPICFIDRMESCSEYASRGYWEGRYAKQLKIKAMGIVEGPEQSKDSNSEAASGELAFEWLCEFCDLQPLLVHLLSPEKIELMSAGHLCPQASTSEHYDEESGGPESRSPPPHGVPNSINDLVTMLKNIAHSSMHQANASDDCNKPDPDLDPSGQCSPSSTSRRGYAVLDLGTG